MGLRRRNFWEGPGSIHTEYLESKYLLSSIVRLTRITREAHVRVCQNICQNIFSGAQNDTLTRVEVMCTGEVKCPDWILILL